MSTAAWTISAIAILIAMAIAWNEFGGTQDLQRLLRRLRRRGPSA
jgi:hypothetical protein